MEREALYATLSSALFVTVVLGFAAGTPRAGMPRAPLSERRAWWSLVGPAFAGLVVFAFLTGWVLQEPDPADEWVSLPVQLFAGAAALVLLRASWRAVSCLRPSAFEHLPIATVGLFRCRAVVSPGFLRAARPALLSAALAHESAHARGHDPLRIWLAQIATDLQWPVAGAGVRFQRWLLALELRRDVEAVAHGARPVDLAEALLIAARLSLPGHGPDASAAMARGGADVALRVRRLLHWVDGEQRGIGRRPRRAATLTICTLLLLGSGWLGLSFGEQILGLLPGVCR